MKNLLIFFALLFGTSAFGQLAESTNGFYEYSTNLDTAQAEGILDEFDYQINSSNPLQASGMISTMVRKFAPVEINFKVKQKNQKLVFTGFTIKGGVSSASTRLKDIPLKYRKKWIATINEKLDPVWKQLNGDQ